MRHRGPRKKLGWRYWAIHLPLVVLVLGFCAYMVWRNAT